MNSISSPPDGTGPAFSSYDQVERHLDELDFFRMTPGLERISAVLESLGLTRPPFVSIQIAGTNGKGSTAAMVSALAREHGLSTGLYTSPHFLSPRERIRVNGEMLPEQTWVSLGSRVMAAGGRVLSYFEFVTALAVLAFAEAGVAMGVMETGLGGTFDAVTALDADLVVLTPMGLDHQAVLGKTLREIALDKAGVIRQGKPVISAPQQVEAWREIVRKSHEQQASLYWVEPDFTVVREERRTEDGAHDCGQHDPHHGPRLPLPAPPAERKDFTLRCQALPASIASGDQPLRLRGEHQKLNACLALAAWEYLARERWPALAEKGGMTREETNAAALAKAWLPGRMQFLPASEAPSGTEEFAAYFLPGPLGWPPMLLDGAHNAHGLAALGLSLAREGIAPGAVIFACLEDKVSESVLHHLRALATGPIFVPALAHNPRALAPEALAAAIGVNAVAEDSVRGALEQAARNMAERLPEAFDGSPSKNPLLVCGSLYLLGEVFDLRPEALEQFGGRWG